MATTADSAASSTRSPRSPGFSGDTLNSPQFPRNARNLPSPWLHVVRGESEAVPAAPSSPASSPSIASPEQIPLSDCSPMISSSPSMSSSDSSAVEAQSDISDNGNSVVTRGKKPAWNKPSNGSVEVNPVMGAFSWPALSESTKASPKSSSDSSKVISDGSVSVSQGPVISSSPKKQVSSNANPNSTPNHTLPMRQKSMKRGGGGGGPANGGFTHPQPPPPPPPPKVEMPQNNSGKPGHVIPDSSPRDPPHKINTWGSGPRGGFVSQPHIGNDHPQHRNSFRRGGSGPHMRGEGSYHNNHGGRRDQDRANHEWNPHRSFNGRDVHMPQQRVVQRNFIRPPPLSTAPFISSPPVSPFGNPMGFPDMTSPVYYVPPPPPESLRGVPFVHATPFAMFLPAPDPQLRTMLVTQIDYYFSYENLCKDTFLRKNMDEQGWVPISLIANFNRVKQLTDDIQFILDTVRTSTVVEVQGDKIRKRNDWMSWLLPPPNQSSAWGPQSLGISSHDMLANRIESVGLEEGKPANAKSPTETHKEAIPNISSSGGSNIQSQTSIGEGQFKQVLGN